MVEIVETKNPNVLKFTLGKNVFESSREYNRQTQNEDFPLAQRLLDFPFVMTLLTMDDFIAIQIMDGVEWEDVQTELVDIIEEEMKKFHPQKAKPMEVYVEETPNPNVKKLITNHLLYEGIAEAHNMEEAKDFPLAQYLLELPYIQGVFVTDNYISLTKVEGEKWENYDFEIRDIVSEYLRQGRPIVQENYIPSNQEVERKEAKEFTDIEKKIQDILEEYVKPAVINDGGNIDLIEFDEESKTAKMLLQGACSGCPSSTITLKNGIETILKQMLPNQVEEVIAINQ